MSSRWSVPMRMMGSYLMISWLGWYDDSRIAMGSPTMVAWKYQQIKDLWEFSSFRSWHYQGDVLVYSTKLMIALYHCCTLHSYWLYPWHDPKLSLKKETHIGAIFLSDTGCDLLVLRTMVPNHWHWFTIIVIRLAIQSPDPRYWSPVAVSTRVPLNADNPTNRGLIILPLVNLNIVRHCPCYPISDKSIVDLQRCKNSVHPIARIISFIRQWYHHRFLISMVSRL